MKARWIKAGLKVTDMCHEMHGEVLIHVEQKTGIKVVYHPKKHRTEALIPCTSDDDRKRVAVAWDSYYGI